MTVSQINSSNIVSGTISSSKISSGVVNKLNIPQVSFENDVISWDDYNVWGSVVKNCVIYDVPRWSAYRTMNNKVDTDGNIFVIE